MTSSKVEAIVIECQNSGSIAECLLVVPCARIAEGPLPTHLRTWRGQLRSRSMRNAPILLPLIATASLLCGCDRLDPLVVLDSADGSAVIQDVLATRSGDRIICVSSDIRQSCTRSSADVIVSQIANPADVAVNWAAYQNHVVIVDVASGNLERSPRTALNGLVTIEYR